jgi:tetratricopeptide (TPR) repeat protein
MRHNAALLHAARRSDLPPLAAGWRPTGAEALDIARAARTSRRTADAARWLQRAGEDATAARADWELEAGRLALAAGQPERAVETFSATLRHAPESLHAAQELARLRFMQGRTAEALALVPRASRPQALQTRESADLALQLLEATIERGDAATAVAAVEDLLAAADTMHLDATSHARLWAVAARVAASEREPETATAAAERALELNPQCTLAWRVLGTLAFEAQRWPDAVRWWERLVEYRQTGPDLLVPLAMAYQRAGRLQDARRTVRRALAEDPQHRAALRLRDELGA